MEHEAHSLMEREPFRRAEPTPAQRSSSARNRSPSPRWGKPAVAVLGGDDDGLSAAAVMLAGHLPHVWDQKGPNTDEIADDAREFLAAKGVAVSSAAASAI